MSEFHVVPARREHHGEFARFFAGLELDDPVPGVETWAAEMAPSTFFLADGARFVGYAYGDSYGARAYVVHVVVDAETRGRGVGRALMRELARRFRAAGSTSWELNVKPGNRRAIALYERCGMRAQYPSHALRIDWADVPKLPHSTRVVEARGVEPADDAAIERAFDLPDGRVARVRGFAGQVLVQLVERGSVVAFARYNPSFPGCFPFRVAEPALARVLLDELAPHARRGDPWIQLVIEDDERTTAALLAAGARTSLDIVHMGGAIPSDDDAAFHSDSRFC